MERYPDTVEAIERLDEALKASHGRKILLDGVEIRTGETENDHTVVAIHRVNELSRYIHVHRYSDGTFSVSFAEDGLMVELSIRSDGQASCNDGNGRETMFWQTDFIVWAERVIAATQVAA